MLHADVCGIDEENLDEVSITMWMRNSSRISIENLFVIFLQVLNLLSDTDWGQSVEECRLIRNNLCSLLGIKPPITTAKK